MVADGVGAPALRPSAGGPALPGRAGGPAAGESAVLLLRPEKLRLGPSVADAHDGGFAAMVEDLVYVGDITRLTVRLAGGPEITVKQPNRADMFRPARGDKVHVQWAREDAVLLPSGGTTGMGRNL